MTSHAIPSRPKTSGTRSLRTVCRPCRRASTSTSAAVADSIGRSAGGGPWRRVSIMLPPGLITETSFRNARARALVGTCIHTALSQIRSKVSFERRTFSSAGRESSIHRMWGNGGALSPHRAFLTQARPRRPCSHSPRTRPHPFRCRRPCRERRRPHPAAGRARMREFSRMGGLRIRAPAWALRRCSWLLRRGR